MSKFRHLIGVLAIVGWFGGDAAAQNVPSNPGRWWTQPQSGSVWQLYNPLTTIYFRVGGLHSANQNQREGTPAGYFSGSGGIITIPSSPGAFAGIGARLMPVLRSELQISGTFREHMTFADFFLRTFAVPLSSTQIMNNFYFDMAPLFGNALGGANIYVFGGLGVSINSTGDDVNVTVGGTINNTGVTSTRFAWAVGAGVQYQPMNNVIIDLSYRYLDAGRWQFCVAPGCAVNGTLFGNLVAHQAMFSVIIAIDGLLRGF